mgnify:FL=1|tara:strand:+ start:23582 stop:24364 length:783 start_codon:yes stop_codon:yes gene_type:complete
MNITLIIKLSCFIMVLPLQCQAMAEDSKTSTVTNSVKPAMTIYQATNNNLSLNLTQEWGLSALIIAAQDEKNLHNRQVIKQLFSVDDTKVLQRHINKSFQTGLYSLKNSYILSPNYTPLLSAQLLLANAVKNDLYQLGRLSTETGYSDQEQLYQKHFRVFIRSAYNVLHHGKFDLSLTASFESRQAQHSLTPVLEPFNKSPNNEQTSSTTLGIIGSYDLSKHWSLVGAFTSSQINNENINSGLQQKHQLNIAIIGTTYSF